jgi:hypothetical protein
MVEIGNRDREPRARERAERCEATTERRDERPLRAQAGCDSKVMPSCQAHPTAGPLARGHAWAQDGGALGLVNIQNEEPSTLIVCTPFGNQCNHIFFVFFILQLICIADPTVTLISKK